MHLNLGNNNLNEHALIPFSTLVQQSKEIPKLTILQLHNNRLGSPPILASIIKELNTLLVLNLSGIGFQDRGIEILASSISHKNRIEYLDLSNNFLTDTGLQSICDNFHQN
jgi:Ran GTPase-activating protein (RanGAP) involved in mRNA processing and transport